MGISTWPLLTLAGFNDVFWQKFRGSLILPLHSRRERLAPKLSLFQFIKSVNSFSLTMDVTTIVSYHIKCISYVVSISLFFLMKNSRETEIFSLSFSSARICTYIIKYSTALRCWIDRNCCHSIIQRISLILEKHNIVELVKFMRVNNLRECSLYGIFRSFFLPLLSLVENLILLVYLYFRCGFFVLFLNIPFWISCLYHVVVCYYQILSILYFSEFYFFLCTCVCFCIAFYTDLKLEFNCVKVQLCSHSEQGNAKWVEARMFVYLLFLHRFQFHFKQSVKVQLTTAGGKGAERGMDLICVRRRRGIDYVCFNDRYVSVYSLQSARAIEIMLIYISNVIPWNIDDVTM